MENVPMDSAAFVEQKRDEMLAQAMNELSNLLDLLTVESFKLSTEGELYAIVAQCEPCRKLAKMRYTAFWEKYCEADFDNQLEKLGWSFNPNVGILRVRNMSEDND